MADRTSAELFGILFEVLAEEPTEENKVLAKTFYELSERYDFSYSQMEADEALVTLGLAKRFTDPDWPDEGEQVFYFGETELPLW